MHTTKIQTLNAYPVAASRKYGPDGMVADSSAKMLNVMPSGDVVEPVTASGRNIAERR